MSNFPIPAAVAVLPAVAAGIQTPFSTFYYGAVAPFGTPVVLPDPTLRPRKPLDVLRIYLPFYFFFHGAPPALNATVFLKLADGGTVFWTWTGALAMKQQTGGGGASVGNTVISDDLVNPIRFETWDAPVLTAAAIGDQAGTGSNGIGIGLQTPDPNVPTATVFPGAVDYAIVAD